MMRILFVLSIFCFFICCSDKRIELTDQEAVQLVNRELLNNISLSYSDSGKTVMRITAPEMLRYISGSDSKDEFTKGLTAFFYTNNILNNTLKANYAIRVVQEGKTYLSDQVVLFNDRGEKLETAELIWDERNGKVIADKFFRLTRLDETVQGYGFESDQNFTSVKMKNIEASFPSKKLVGDLNEE